MSDRMLMIERALWAEGYSHVAGVDEVGRGALAGPVIAGAVILPEGTFIPGVDDSKKLRPSGREAAYRIIREKALAVGVGVCDPETIDRMNILHAALEAMRRAVEALDSAPSFLLVDGNRCFPNCELPFRTVVGGDAKSHSIAAASIIAKVTRDRLMRDLHRQYPDYGWNTNVGYPTQAHYAGLGVVGPSLHHRRSFRLAK